jgi:PIN domain nuclease of toxin-antitoxin system
VRGGEYEQMCLCVCMAVRVVPVSKGFCDSHFTTHFITQDHEDSLSLMRAVEFDQAFTFAYSGNKLCSKVCVTTLYSLVKCVV